MGSSVSAATTLTGLLQANWPILSVFTGIDQRGGRGRKVLINPVKSISLEHGLQLHQPPRLDRVAIEAVMRLKPDMLIVVSYGLLLPQEMLRAGKFGAINIHYSLLPRWRGAAPVCRAIEHGDSMSGISIMQMSQNLDAGPIYAQLSIAIQPTDTTATLTDRLSKNAVAILNTTMQEILKGDAKAVEQDDQLASYAKKLNKGDGIIDWQQPAIAIERKIRAMQDWPLARTNHQGTTLIIYQSQASNSDGGCQPGTIVDFSDRSIRVQCGVGSLLIQRLQRPGGRVLITRDFLSGYSIQAGEMLS